MKTTACKPYVANYPPLKAWLDKHKGRCNWQLPLGSDPESPTAYIESWMMPNGRSVIVTVWANHNGWDIATPEPSGMIEAALADAEARLGLTGGAS